MNGYWRSCWLFCLEAVCPNARNRPLPRPTDRPCAAAAAARAVVQDSGATRVLTLPFLEPLAGTLDSWLLQQWWVGGAGACCSSAAVGGVDGRAGMGQLQGLDRTHHPEYPGQLAAAAVVVGVGQPQGRESAAWRRAQRADRTSPALPSPACCPACLPACLPTCPPAPPAFSASAARPQVQQLRQALRRLLSAGTAAARQPHHPWHGGGVGGGAAAAIHSAGQPDRHPRPARRHLTGTHAPCSAPAARRAQRLPAGRPATVCNRPRAPTESSACSPAPTRDLAASASTALHLCLRLRFPAAAAAAPCCLISPFAAKQLPHLLPELPSHPLPSPPQFHSALLRWITGDPGAGIALTSHPLAVLPHEAAVRIGEAAGGRWLPAWQQLSHPEHESATALQAFSGCSCREL